MALQTLRDPPTELSAAQLLQQGQVACSDKKYEEAREIFDKALTAAKHQSANSIQVLDHLIGVHIKLDQRDVAIAKAKSMVRIDRSDARGYLRCGQIERLNENFDAACKWYEHGMKNTGDNDKLGRTLSTSLARTRELSAKKRSYSRPCDPMASLPLEVAGMVLGYLDYKEHTKMLRVSKSWRKFLTRLRPIIDTIDFSGSKRTVSFSMIRAAVRRLTNYPICVVIARLSELAIRYLNKRLQLWYKRPTIQRIVTYDVRLDLTNVHLQDFPLRSLKLSALISLRCFKNILQQCSRLQDLQVECWECDREESMVFPSSFRQRELRKLIISTAAPWKDFSYFPNLTHLEFNWICRGPDFEQLSLEFNPELKYAEVYAGKAHIKLHQNLETFKSRMRDSGSTSFTIPAPSGLCHLELRCWGESLDNLVALFNRCALNNLRTLGIDLNDSRGFDQIDIDVLFGHFSRLEHLRLKSDKMGDRNLRNLVGNTPNLRSLILQDTLCTGAFLADLIRAKSCQLKSLGLEGCFQVSSDTWDWIRQRNVRLTVRNESDASGNSGGRRVVDTR